MTSAFVSSWLKHLFQNLAVANVGDVSGLQPSAAAGSLYVSLHTADPGLAGDQTTNETSYTSYARVAVARSSGGWTEASQVMSNTAQLNFPQCTGTGATLMFWGIGTASSGAGVLIESGPLGSALGPFVGENSNDQITIKGHGLSVDDRVVFFPRPDDSTPTGITAGTVYFVKTVVDVDNITIAATSGGTTIDITADGDGFGFKVTPIAVSNLITPQVSAGQLTVKMG